MKRFTLLAAFSICFFTVFARDYNVSTPAGSSIPRVYIMMVRGKLIEVNRKKRNRVKRDITLLNHTTIHPNGTIDSGSGENLQLQEGQYMTMDGRIRYLKDMGR